ncbi:MAG: SGNH/GDSL hydrolase family protein [Chitinophagaceae bacterium]|nr:SGNH/GDSL hydrolase family protein [Chitinophagaceae bacterium]
MNTPKFNGSLRLLALGDSYTVGEGVAPEDNFPSQLATLLKEKKIHLILTRIAKTGWTTDELAQAIQEAEERHELSDIYDFVTLLIGVNNQYRNRSLEHYRQEFEKLLQKALSYVQEIPERITVLSIPDWSVTPFAEGKNRLQIAKEIDEFNAVNYSLALKYKTNYLDITSWSREAAQKPELLTTDGLHPSAIEYKRWAEKLAGWILGYYNKHK